MTLTYVLEGINDINTPRALKVMNVMSIISIIPFTSILASPDLTPRWIRTIQTSSGRSDYIFHSQTLKLHKNIVSES